MYAIVSWQLNILVVTIFILCNIIKDNKQVDIQIFWLKIHPQVAVEEYLT